MLPRIFERMLPSYTHVHVIRQQNCTGHWEHVPLSQTWLGTVFLALKILHKGTQLIWCGCQAIVAVSFCSLTKNHIKQWETDQKIAHWSNVLKLRQSNKFIQPLLPNLCWTSIWKPTIMVLSAGHSLLRYHCKKMGRVPNSILGLHHSKCFLGLITLGWINPHVLNSGLFFAWSAYFLLSLQLWMSSSTSSLTLIVLLLGFHSNNNLIVASSSKLHISPNHFMLYFWWFEFFPQFIIRQYSIFIIC